MLMEGVLEKLGRAQSLLKIHDYEGKGEQISWAMSIIGGLRDSLNIDEGGEIAENLDKLYAYMLSKLLEANVQNNCELIDEVIQLMLHIKSGWDGIKQ